MYMFCPISWYVPWIYAPLIALFFFFSFHFHLVTFSHVILSNLKFFIWPSQTGIILPVNHPKWHEQHKVPFLIVFALAVRDSADGWKCVATAALALYTEFAFTCINNDDSISFCLHREERGRLQMLLVKEWFACLCGSRTHWFCSDPLDWLARFTCAKALCNHIVITI